MQDIGSEDRHKKCEKDDKGWKSDDAKDQLVCVCLFICFKHI